jgi:protein-S-isoprenylcysteine O-methyltransferase Ste14
MGNEKPIIALIVALIAALFFLFVFFPAFGEALRINMTFVIIAFVILVLGLIAAIIIYLFKGYPY